MKTRRFALCLATVFLVAIYINIQRSHTFTLSNDEGNIKTENEPTISLLRKLGFREVEDGPIMVVLGNIFEKEDNFFAHEVVKLVLTKEEFSDGN